MGSFFPGVFGWVLSLATSECGSWLAASGRNGVVRVFDIDAVLQFDNQFFSGIALRPAHQVGIWKNPPGCFFLDGQDHLHSTLPTRDSSHLPLRCHSAFVDSSKGIVLAALPEEIRALHPETGEPLRCHPVRAGNRISMAINSDRSRLAVLERKRIVVYDVSGDFSILRELVVIPLDALLTEDDFHKAGLRDDLPIAFCGDDRLVVPLERIVFVRVSEGNMMTTPDLHHRLAIVKIQDQAITPAFQYEGFCTALTVLTGGAQVVVGVGDQMVSTVRTGEELEVTGSVLLEGPKTGVFVLDESAQVVQRFYGSTEADLGVSSMAACPSAKLLAVAFRSGRVRLAKLLTPDWMSSICLDYSATALEFADEGTHLLAADDGGGTAYWPVVHKLRIITGLPERNEA
jgi:hypothetical protein